ncbi:GNAT family N-acetyltransferase [Pseudonocardia spirodelae]|uniref:GNAT family N-acetyltransferase n=1 Tax=Pseudonocardia spirodelae TaxID=3133431 RepID=A0ABU8T9N2_9PSEU
MPAPPATAPVLTDGTVTLRAPAAADVPGMLEAYRDPVVQRWTSLDPASGEREAHEWIAASARRWAGGRQFVWAVEAADGGRPRWAGSVDLRRDPVPSVGFLLAPWARGRGWASRALRLAADWGFDVAGFAALHWDARAGHVASWRVAHACGFRFDGVRTLALPAEGGLVDAWTAVLLPGTPVADREPATTWWPHPVLDGDGVRLRPPCAADLPRHVESCNDPDARWWSATLPVPYTDDDARRWLRAQQLEPSLGAAVTWTVADPDDDRYLAVVTLFGTDRPYTPTGAEIGYRAHPDARGRGAVSAAVRRLVAHAFTPVADGGMGRHRLQIGAAADNAASRRVAERAGFRLWGTPRGDGVHGFANEIVDDGVWYELLAGDPVPSPSGTVGGTP